MTARSRDLFGQRNDDAAAVARLAFLKRLTASVRLDLRRLRDGGALPFSFPASFADAAADGGFDVIVGNPPWIRTHNLDHRSRSELRERFFVYRHSAWLGGSSVARAGRGFASQVDASALFAERCSELLRHDGAMALLLPAKLWRSLAGGGARELLRTRMNLRELHDLTDARHEFGAAVYPSILVASRSDSTHGNDDQAQCIRASSADTLSARPFRIAPRALPFDESAGSPWLLVPSGVRSAFDALRACGIPLSRSRLGRPLMGVKTGCNEAFIVQHGSEIENEMLRPVVKGDQVSPWCIHWTSDQIIWTHDAHGPLEILPAGAHRHLRAYRRALELRADARGKRKWWMLFRTESADASKPRVVWSDFGKRPRAAILSAGNQAVPINSCYVIRCECEADAFTLAALMNSEVARAWLSLIAEPARGGYRRYMGWTMAVLPVPSDWPRAQSILAPLACKAIEETMPPEHELTSAVLDAFGVTCRTVEPLLAWSRQPGS